MSTLKNYSYPYNLIMDMYDAKCFDFLHVSGSKLSLYYAINPCTDVEPFCQDVWVSEAYVKRNISAYNDMIDKFLCNVSERKRNVFLSYYQDGLSYEEIAEKYQFKSSKAVANFIRNSFAKYKNRKNYCEIIKNDELARFGVLNPNGMTEFMSACNLSNDKLPYDFNKFFPRVCQPVLFANSNSFREYHSVLTTMEFVCSLTECLFISYRFFYDWKTEEIAESFEINKKYVVFIIDKALRKMSNANFILDLIITKEQQNERLYEALNEAYGYPKDSDKLNYLQHIVKDAHVGSIAEFMAFWTKDGNFYSKDVKEAREWLQEKLDSGDIKLE